MPKHWPIYRSFDYGFDMFALSWWAVDEDGRSWCIRYYEHKGLVVQDAAKAALENTPPGEKVLITYAPPDMWNRQKDTGRTLAESFAKYGLPIVRSDNNRVQGHMIMKDMLTPAPLKDPFVRRLYPEGKAPDKLPMLMFFDTCSKLTSDICDIQADDNDPNDCAKQPHSITHSVDSARYYCISRTIAAEGEKAVAEIEEAEEERREDYEHFMCGGDCDASYMVY